MTFQHHQSNRWHPRAMTQPRDKRSADAEAAKQRALKAHREGERNLGEIAKAAKRGKKRTSTYLSEAGLSCNDPVPGATSTDAGLLDDDVVANLSYTEEPAEHPDGSLSDRIQAARAQGLYPLEEDSELPNVAGDASSAVGGNVSPDEVAVGQVWRTDGPHRMLVWIRTTFDVPVVVCHPATTNLAIADNSTLIVYHFEPLGRPLGILTSIGSTLPTDRLATFVGTLDIAADVNCLRDGSPPERPTGLPITGVEDERCVLQQMVADELYGLDPIDEDDDEDGTGGMSYPNV